jgi:hypothetical protein
MKTPLAMLAATGVTGAVAQITTVKGNFFRASAWCRTA